MRANSHVKTSKNFLRLRRPKNLSMILEEPVLVLGYAEALKPRVAQRLLKYMRAVGLYSNKEGITEDDFHDAYEEIEG